MSKIVIDIKYNSQQSTDVSDLLLKGAKVVNDTVGATMGPGGKLVITPGNRHYPKVTKDGVSVAQLLSDPDQHVNLGIDMVVQACNKQVMEVGDGTTLTAVLSYSLFRNGLKHIQSGTNMRELIHDLKMSSKEIISYLHSNAKEITTMEELVHIATISSNGDEELGRLIGEASYKIGPLGFFTYKMVNKPHHSVEFDKGIHLDTGTLPAFSNYKDQAKKNNVPAAVICDNEENPFVLVTEHEFSFAEDLKPIMVLLQEYNKEHSTDKRLIIVSPSIDNHALSSLIRNVESGKIKAAWIKPCKTMSAYEIESNLEDIAVMVGAKNFTKNSGHDLRKIRFEDLGVATLFRSDFFDTQICGDPDPDRLERRKQELQSYIDQDEIGGLKKEFAEKSLARLVGGMARFSIGGQNDTSQKEVQDRVDDARRACVAALKKGVISGGGVAFLDARNAVLKSVSPLSPGEKILFDSMTAPILKILNNSVRSDADLITQRIDSEAGAYTIDEGYQTHTTMIDLNIVDPVLVLTHAIKNAVDVVCTMLQTAVSITGKEI